MARIISLITALIFLQCTLHAQIPYGILPSGITGIELADTMLNTKEVLLRAGIRSYSYQITPAPEKRFDAQTVYVNKQGKIIAYKACMTKAGERPGFCVRDTFLYDEKGRFLTSISFDRGGKEERRKIADYSNERDVKYMNVFAASNPDTSFEFRDYNEKGLLTGIMHIRNINGRKDIVYTKLYYNNNGGLDSAHDGFSWYGTIILKKKVQKDKAMIEAVNKAYRFKWTYDASGKCIEMEWNSIKQKVSLKFLSRYLYNADGTLAKVTEKAGKTPEYVINYTYEKW
jgi:hypothetical protein